MRATYWLDPCRAGDLSHPACYKAEPTYLEHGSKTGKVLQESSTEIRALWTDQYLYVGFKVFFEILNTFQPPNLTGEPMPLGKRCGRNVHWLGAEKDWTIQGIPGGT